MTEKLYVYVAGPISKGDQLLNVREAIVVADRLLERGHIPFIPHLTALWHLLCPHGYEEWMTYDAWWLDKCDVLLRIAGDSDGADREVAAAVASGKPVFFGLDEFMKSPLWARQDGRPV